VSSQESAFRPLSGKRTLLASASNLDDIVLTIPENQINAIEKENELMDSEIEAVTGKLTFVSRRMSKVASTYIAPVKRGKLLALIQRCKV
jgi:hypothetical protein